MRRLLIVCALAATVSISGRSGAEILMDRVVAVVNQDVVTWSELYRAMELDASPQLRELKNDERLKIFRENEGQFLESLINVRLQLQEAAAQGLGAGDDEVKEGIAGVMKKYGMDDAAFRESLKKEGYTLEEYRRRFREQIIISKLVNHQIRSKIIVTDKDVRKYVDEMTARGENEPGFRISQIFFRKPLTSEGRKTVEEKAAEALKRLEAGEGFKAVATSFSEDASAAAGGEIGVIKKSELGREFGEALARMKSGDVSKPFWTDKGLHIIRLDELIEPRSAAEFEENARKELTEHLFTEKYNAWIKSLRERAFIEIRL